MLQDKPIAPVPKQWPLTTIFGKWGRSWKRHINPETGLWVQGQLAKPEFRDLVGQHTGYDFACPVGTEAYAVVDANVSYTERNHPTIGNFIILIAQNQMAITYAHLSEIKVRTGMKVLQGDVIGLTGNTGNVYPKPTKDNPNAGAHLHISFQDAKHQYVAIDW